MAKMVLFFPNFQMIPLMKEVTERCKQSSAFRPLMAPKFIRKVIRFACPNLCISPSGEYHVRDVEESYELSGTGEI